MSAEDNIKRRERVRRSHQTRLREGTYRAGSVPLGYRRQSVDDPRTGRRTGTAYVAVEPEASLVRRIFGEFLAGASLGGIAKRLNAEGVPTKRDGASWYGATIKIIIDNPVYAGVMREQRTGLLYPASNVEAVIDWGTSEAARRLLKEIGWHRPGSNARESIYSGLLECKHCGAPLYRVKCRDTRRPRRPDGSVHVDHYWRCSTRMNSGGCQAPSIREDRLLDLLRSGLPLIFGKELWEDRRRMAGEQAGGLRAELEGLEQQQKILLKRELDGDLRGDVFEELNAPILRRIDQITAELGAVSHVPEGLDAEEIAAILDRPEQLKIWLRRCVRSLTIGDGRLVAARLVDEQWDDVLPLLDEWEVEILEIDPRDGRLLRLLEWYDDDEEDDGGDGSSGEPVRADLAASDPDSEPLHADPATVSRNEAPGQASSTSSRQATTILNSQDRSNAPSGSASRLRCSVGQSTPCALSQQPGRFSATHNSPAGRGKGRRQARFSLAQEDDGP